MRTTRAWRHDRPLEPGTRGQLIARDQGHSPFIDDEPLFVIRGRDRFAIPVLLMLKLIYDVTDEEIADWYEWQNSHERHIRYPQSMMRRFDLPRFPDDVAGSGDLP